MQEENLSAEKTERLIGDYLFAEREPLSNEMIELIKGEKPGFQLTDKIIYANVFADLPV